MAELFIKIPDQGYYFNNHGIATIEEFYGAKYMGYWCTKNSKDHWNEVPVDVFYQANPKTELGHSHYFGMYIQNEQVMITNAESAFTDPIIGMICEDGEVIVSRYRHDYVEKGDRMIDGGRDYVRTSGHPTATITVEGDRFIIKEEIDA